MLSSYYVQDSYNSYFTDQTFSPLYNNAKPSIGYSFAAAKPNTVASFTIPVGEQYHIDLGMLGMDGKMHKLKILADTGNDITLLKRETAEDMLGINPDQFPEDTIFPIIGITDTPVYAKEITNMIQFGDLRPVWVRMGIITERGIFSEDLLGRKDILDNGLYEVVYDQDSVEFREKHINVTLPSAEQEIGGFNPRISSKERESMKPFRNPNGSVGNEFMDWSYGAEYPASNGEGIAYGSIAI